MTTIIEFINSSNLTFHVENSKGNDREIQLIFNIAVHGVLYYIIQLAATFLNISIIIVVDND